MNSPTEVYLLLKDAKGNQLAASNPALGPRIDFTAPADGDYTLGVEHLLYAHGPSESYRITVMPFVPGFEVTLGIDRFDVAPGSVTAIPVYAQRYGYAGPIAVRVLAAPQITGSTTILPGPLQLKTYSPPAPNQLAATLFLSAGADAPPGPYNIALEASAVIGGKPVVQNVNLKSLVSQNLAGLAYPPQSLFSRIGVAVTQKPPFTLSAHFDRAEGIRGQPIALTIGATRVTGFTDEIALSAANLPSKSLSAALKNIPRGRIDVKVQLHAAANAALGSFPVSFTGKSKFQGRDVAVTTSPILLVLVMPFDLQVDAAPVKLLPGGKAKIKVSATRNGGYQGPITLEVRNLPGFVTAAKMTLAAGQDAAELELSAAANATAVQKADVNVLGTASAAGNQQQASANFLVTIAKK